MKFWLTITNTLIKHCKHLELKSTIWRKNHYCATLTSCHLSKSSGLLPFPLHKSSIKNRKSLIIKMSVGMAFALLTSSMHYCIILNVSSVHTTTVTGIICYHFNLFYIWYNFEGGKFCVGWGYDRNDALTIFIVHVHVRFIF